MKKVFNKKIQKAFIGALLITAIISTFYYNTKNVQGTDFTFTQTSWSGGQTAGSATHTNNQTGWDQFSSQTNINTSVAGDVSLTSGITSNNSVTETFANANAKDTTNTTANWDTVNQQIKGIPGVDAEDLYAKLNGTMGGEINVAVKAGDDLFIGARRGRFAKYNITTNSITDLSNLIESFWVYSDIVSLAIDSNHGVVYLGSNGGKFASYEISGNVITNLSTSTDSVFGPSSTINAMTFDASHDTLYLGGRASSTAKFLKYDVLGQNAVDLSSTLSSFWPATNGTITSFLIDENVNKLYIGGYSGSTPTRAEFAVYSIDSNITYNLYDSISSFSALNIRAFAIDSANQMLYLAGYGKFIRYDIEQGTAANLPNAASTFNSNEIYSLAFDADDNAIYLGGGNRRFVKYNIATNTAVDLSSKVSAFWVYNNINFLLWDPAERSLYIGGGSGKFAKYESDINAATDLTNVVSSFWGGKTVNSLELDLANDQIYLFGGSGRFAKYDLTTKIIVDLTGPISSLCGANTIYTSLLVGTDIYMGCSSNFLKYEINTSNVVNLTSLISPFWIGGITSLKYDSQNDDIYIFGGTTGTGNNVRFAKYDLGTNSVTDLSSLIIPFWGSTVSPASLAIDNIHSVVYIGGWSSRFVKYDIVSNIATNLTSRISSFWGTGIVNSLATDPDSGIVYLGGAGRFAKYSLDDDTVTNLTNTITVLWGGYAVNSLTFDPTNNFLYFGSSLGKFAKYDIGTSTMINLTSSVAAAMRNSTIVSSVINPTTGKIYLGGGAGEFAIGHVSNSRAQSTTLDTVSDLITSATLTKHDTPGAESITYLLSNDGGANFFQVTPGVAHTFTTTGSNLKFRTLLSGYATIEDISISYTSVGNAKNGELISSVYNTTVSGASLSQLQWTENLGVNTDIAFQLRTSPNGTTWTNWCGPDDAVEGSCNTTTYFTNSTQTIDDTQRDKLNDQYFQYKAILTSTDGQNTPTLSDVTVSYATSSVASVTTQSASNITINSATLNAQITDTGGENPTRQIEYGTTNNGPYPNSCTQGTGGAGTYSCNISNLTPNTTYYYRAKATNSAGTVYGDQMSFTTLSLQDIIIPYPDQTKVSEAVSDGYMTLNSGQVNNTDKVQTAVNVTFRTDNADAVFPANTEVTKSDNTAFNFAQFITTNVTSEVRQENNTALVAVKIGVPNMRLSFSQPITIKLNVGQAYNGSSMSIQYQEDGEATWNDHGSCVVTNGQCIFTTTHATTYTVNGSGSIAGAAQNDITTDVQDVLSLDCDQTGNTNDNIVEFGNLTPGTPVTASTTCTVTTNSDAGYTLAVKRNDITSTMDKDGDENTDIADRTTWNSTTPNATIWQTNDTGLAFTVYNTTATKNTSWWGTGTTVTDANNKYAGFPTSYTDIMQHTEYDETATTTQIGYKLDVPTTQKSGIYSGDITYQVVTAP